MAVQPNELFNSGPGNSLFRVIPKEVQEKTVSAIGGAPLLAVLTPMAYNTATNKWVVWTSGGANGTGTISGFLWPDPCQTDAVNDTNAVVMLMTGTVHHDDIPVPVGETQLNLDASLKVGPRSLGLLIQGLPGVH